MTTRRPRQLGSAVSQRVTRWRGPLLSVIKRVLRSAVSRLMLAGLAFTLYEFVLRINPITLVANRRYRLHGSPDGLPVPPPHLIFLVAGTNDISWFLDRGRRSAADITDALDRRGQSVEGLGAILEFGCGCGRVLRYWRGLSNTRVCGTDYNPELTEWCAANLPFVETRRNQLAPPLSYRNGQFDLVYAISVFTHLTEDLQRPWMQELVRVLKPGGILVVTTMGARYLLRMGGREREEFSSGRLVVKDDVRSPGSNMCAAYHPMTYVRDYLTEGVSLAEFVPGGASGAPHQDLFVFSKPPAVAPTRSSVTVSQQV